MKSHKKSIMRMLEKNMNSMSAKQIRGALGLKKSTTAKLIILWNLPALLVLAGAYEVGSNIFA